MRPTCRPTRGEKLVTDAEVLQEILHRYRGLSRTDAIQPAFDCLLGLVDEVFSITVDETLLARDVLLRRPVGRWVRRAYTCTT